MMKGTDRVRVSQLGKPDARGLMRCVDIVEAAASAVEVMVWLWLSVGGCGRACSGDSRGSVLVLVGVVMEVMTTLDIVIADSSEASLEDVIIINECIGKSALK